MVTYSTLTPWFKGHLLWESYAKRHKVAYCSLPAIQLFCSQHMLAHSNNTSLSDPVTLLNLFIELAVDISTTLYHPTLAVIISVYKQDPSGINNTSLVTLILQFRGVA